MVVENKRSMEEMIRFVKRTYDAALLSIEYQDMHHYKNEEGGLRCLNLVDMTIFTPSSMDVKFANAPAHSFLEKMTTSWRSFFSSSSKVAWIKHYYVLRKDTIYVYEKDSYEAPIEMIHLEPFSLVSRSLESRQAKFGGRGWVLELARHDQAPLCLSCEDQDAFDKWSECIANAIEECRMNA